jgi:hypothetical protein
MQGTLPPTTVVLPMRLATTPPLSRRKHRVSVMWRARWSKRQMSQGGQHRGRRCHLLHARDMKRKLYTRLCSQQKRDGIRHMMRIPGKLTKTSWK